MHLNDHLAPDAFFPEAVEDAYHCHLDDVCLRTLDRGIDGIALGESSHGAVLAVDIRQIATAVEEGFGVSLGSCHLFRFLHIGLNAREGAEVIFYDLLRFLVLDVHALGKTEGGDTVDDTEVGGLCLLSLGTGHVLDVFVPDFGSRGSVDIRTFAESLYHVGIFTQMCHDAKLYLRVIRRKE